MIISSGHEYFSVFFFAESAKTRTILNEMIAEAHEIRENQTYRQVAINQAKQLQNHTEETVKTIDHILNVKASLKQLW